MREGYKLGEIDGIILDINVGVPEGIVDGSRVGVRLGMADGDDSVAVLDSAWIGLAVVPVDISICMDLLFSYRRCGCWLLLLLL